MKHIFDFKKYANGQIPALPQWESSYKGRQTTVETNGGSQAENPYNNID